MAQIRFATMGAAEGWAEVVTAASPHFVTSEERVLHEMRHTPGVLARYVAVVDRRVVGIAGLRDVGGDALRISVQVHPDHRGAGIGRLLLDRLLRVAGDSALRTIVYGDGRSIAVAQHWGFELEREHAVSSVDPATVPPAAPAPSGRYVVPLAEAGVERAWACHEAAAEDDPSGLTRHIAFEEYAETQWADPVHRPELGRAVMDGDVVLGYSHVTAVDRRAWNAMTATLPSHRNQGVATLAKQHALNALAASGVTVAWTGNDAANAPMLAVNERLGYRPAATTWGAVRRPRSSGVSPRGPDAVQRTNRG